MATSSNLATSALANVKPQVIQVESIDQVIAQKAWEGGVSPDLARRIAYCESSDRQFDESGKVLRGIKNPSDVGIFQINEQFHLKRSQQHGDDIYTTEGNIDYAIWLLKHGGSQHWGSSKPCWDK